MTVSSLSNQVQRRRKLSLLSMQQKQQQQQQQSNQCCNTSVIVVASIVVVVVIVCIIVLVVLLLLSFVNKNYSTKIQLQKTITTPTTAITITKTEIINSQQLKTTYNMGNENNNNNIYNILNENNNQQQQQQQQQQVQIKTGMINDDVSYYQCTTQNFPSSSKDSTSGKKVKIQLLLLHGSAFTKEDWITSGILHKFCTSSSSSTTAAADTTTTTTTTTTSTTNTTTTTNNSSVILLSVVAFDLHVTSSYTKLRTIIQQLNQQQNQHNMNDSKTKTKTKVKTIIVTPSASGSIIIDWFLNESKDFQQYIHSWIPVASYGILSKLQQHLSLNKRQVSSLLQLDVNNNNNSIDLQQQYYLPILGIYGNLDKKGKQSCIVLQSYINTTIVQELIGTHPVYLDSPNEFVTTIQHFIYSTSTIFFIP